VGVSTNIEFKDAVIIPTTGALLVYWFAATTAPTMYYSVEWEEILA
jgi:hypothetical protein